jgi:hypothetical protein
LSRLTDVVDAVAGQDDELVVRAHRVDTHVGFGDERVCRERHVRPEALLQRRLVLRVTKGTRDSEDAMQAPVVHPATCGFDSGHFVGAHNRLVVAGHVDGHAGMRKHSAAVPGVGDVEPRCRHQVLGFFLVAIGSSSSFDGVCPATAVGAVSDSAVVSRLVAGNSLKTRKHC